MPQKISQILEQYYASYCSTGDLWGSCITNRSNHGNINVCLGCVHEWHWEWFATMHHWIGGWLVAAVERTSDMSSSKTRSFAGIFTKEVLVSGEAAMWQMSARFFLLNRWLKMHSTPKWSCLSVRNYRSHQLENIRNSPATSCRDARGR